VNRNTVRLVVAVLVAWLVGALDGLAVVTKSAWVFVFCAVIVFPVCITLWDLDPLAPRLRVRPWRLPSSQAEVDQNFIAYLVMLVSQRYRVWWLIVTMVLGLLAATVIMFDGLASAVVSLDGEPVHATASDAGSGQAECVLTRPDGSRLPGTLSIPEGETCAATEDVLVDPHGLVDPVRQRDVDGAGIVIGTQVTLLGLALLSCVPAAWPKRTGPSEPPGPGPRQPLADPDARRLRRRGRLPRKPRLRH
jgi:hypothetical protein